MMLCHSLFVLNNLLAAENSALVFRSRRSANDKDKEPINNTSKLLWTFPINVL